MKRMLLKGSASDYDVMVRVMSSCELRGVTLTTNNNPGKLSVLNIYTPVGYDVMKLAKDISVYIENEIDYKTVTETIKTTSQETVITHLTGKDRKLGAYRISISEDAKATPNTVEIQAIVDSDKFIDKLIKGLLLDNGYVEEKTAE